jgi:Flp pilus assembly protein TadB
MTGDVHPEQRERPERRPEAPEAGEAIHLPEPSYLPVVVALGVTIVVVGIVLSPIIVAIGALITIVAIVRWIRATREEMAELPLEH